MHQAVWSSRWSKKRSKSQTGEKVARFSWLSGHFQSKTGRKDAVYIRKLNGSINKKSIYNGQ